MARIEIVGVILANPPRPQAEAVYAHREWDAPRLLRFWHLASLDAPTVAIVWAVAFAWTLGVAVPAWAAAVLGLAVWTIYVVDRLLDARPGHATATRHLLQERHFFHWHHRRALAPAAAVAGLTAFALVAWRLNGFDLRRDSWVAAATLAYFSGVHTHSTVPKRVVRLGRRLVSRQIVVGLIFSAGCVLPLFSTKGVSFPAAFWCVPAVFAALAGLNVHAIGHWDDHPLDVRVRAVLIPAVGLGTIGLLTAVFWASQEPRIAAVLAMGAVSALLIAALERLRPRMTPLALRAAADLVLLTPLAIAVWQLLVR